MFSYQDLMVLTSIITKIIFTAGLVLFCDPDHYQWLFVLQIKVRKVQFCAVGSINSFNNAVNIDPTIGSRIYSLYHSVQYKLGALIYEVGFDY